MGLFSLTSQPVIWINLINDWMLLLLDKNFELEELTVIKGLISANKSIYIFFSFVLKTYLKHTNQYLFT